MKKISVGTALIVLLLCALAFLGGAGALYSFLIRPQISSLKLSANIPAPEQKIPGMEFAGPPLLKPKTTESLSKTAAELDEWTKDLEIWKQKNLIMDEDLRRREELLKQERAAITVERERVVELQTRLENYLSQMKKEESEKKKKFAASDAAHIQEMAQLMALMKVEDTVKMLRQLNDDEVARIMALTKPKLQAKVLGTWLNQFKNEETRMVKIKEAMRQLKAEEKPAEETQ